MNIEDLKCCGNCWNYLVKSGEFWENRIFLCSIEKKPSAPFFVCDSWQYGRVGHKHRLQDTIDYFVKIKVANDI
jgi:hypothetical protein